MKFNRRKKEIRELTEAIRFTVEYVGNDLLPPIEGWSWFDALAKYAPEDAKIFADDPIHLPSDNDDLTAAHAAGVAEGVAKVKAAVEEVLGSINVTDNRNMKQAALDTVRAALAAVECDAS